MDQPIKHLFNIKNYFIWLCVRFVVIATITMIVWILWGNIIMVSLLLLMLLGNLLWFFLNIANDNLANLRLLNVYGDVVAYYDNLMRLHQSAYPVFSKKNRINQQIHLLFTQVLIGDITKAYDALIDLYNQQRQLIERHPMILLQYYLQLTYITFFQYDYSQFAHYYQKYQEVLNQLPQLQSNIIYQRRFSLHQLVCELYRCFIDDDTKAIENVCKFANMEESFVTMSIAIYALYLIDQKSNTKNYRNYYQLLTSTKSNIFFIARIQ